VTYPVSSGSGRNASPDAPMIVVPFVDYAQLVPASNINHYVFN
jgi:hypothetical protein